MKLEDMSGAHLYGLDFIHFIGSILEEEQKERNFSLDGEENIRKILQQKPIGGQFRLESVDSSNESYNGKVFFGWVKKVGYHCPELPANQNPVELPVEDFVAYGEPRVIIGRTEFFPASR